MSSITHELIANLETGAYTVKPPIDIHQGDVNTHVLLIKLRNNDGHFVTIDDNAKPKISFRRDDSEVVSSYTVSVVNSYRGILSYMVGPAFTKTPGRYTVYLDVSNCGCNSRECKRLVISFVITITKTEIYVPPDREITISKEFLDEIRAHLKDTEIHLSAADRQFLDTFTPLSDDLLDLLNTDFKEMIDNRIIEKTGEILRKAFITVDIKSQMTSLPESELCNGKLFRINYPSLTDESEIDYFEEEDPEYWIARYNGTSYSFHKIDLGGYAEEIQKLQSDVEYLTDVVAELQSRTTLLESDVERLKSLVTSIQQEITAINGAFTGTIGSIGNDQVVTYANLSRNNGLVGQSLNVSDTVPTTDPTTKEVATTKAVYNSLLRWSTFAPDTNNFVTSEGEPVVTSDGQNVVVTPDS